MKRLTLLLTCFFISMSLAIGQNTKVAGIVVEESGEPVIGASVVVKGNATLGTVTDIEGRFTLDIPSSAKSLVVSYIGMKSSEVVVSNNMRIVLSTDSKVLDEVVVSALGLKRSEKSLAFSSTQVKSDEIVRSGDRSALNALQGKVAGVSISSSSGAPGSSTRLFIRGFSSIAGSNQPLYVVDGIPVSNGVTASSNSLNNTYDFGNSMNDINPNDIESISILKGAAASSLYGSRAGNGVVLITTKKGAQASDLKVEVMSTTTFSNPLRLTQMQNEFGQGWNGLHYLDENGSWGPKFDGQDRLWGHEVDGQQQYKPYAALKDNLKDYFETGVTYNNSISLNGGGKNSNFHVSYSNIYDDGINPGNKDTYSRNALSARGEIKGKKATLLGSFNYTNKNTSFVGGGQGLTVYNDLMQIPRDLSIIDMKDYHNKFYNLDNFYTPYGIVNPFWTLNENGSEYGEDRVFGSVELGFQFLPWLKGTGRIGSDYKSYETIRYTAVVHPTPGSPNAGSSIEEPGSYGQTNGSTRELNADLFLSFNHDITEDLNINGIVGYNLNQRQASYLSSSIPSLNIPNFYNIANSKDSPTSDNYNRLRRLYGVYAQADLGFKNWIYLNVGARNDWSSTLPKNGNSFFYPSVGFSFLPSDFYPELKSVLNYSKVRASYGATGNDAEPYSLQSIFGPAGVTFGGGRTYLDFPINGVNGFEVGNTIGNPALKPELTYEFEIGTDLRFFDSLFGIDFTYYDKRTTEQILPVPLATSSGYSSQYMNLGQVSNKGVEMLLTVNPVRTKSTNWEFSFNFTKNKNRVDKLSDLIPDGVSLGGFTGFEYRAVVGQPLGMYRTSLAERDPEGHIVVTSTGIPVQATEMSYLGNSQHKFMLGFNNKFSFKGCTLAFSLDYRNGGKIYSRTADINSFVGNSPYTTYNDRKPFIIPNSVQKYTEGGVVKYIENRTPIARSYIDDYWNNGGVDYNGAWLLDRSYVKLRDVTISYDLPKSILKRISFSSLTVSLVGNNLLLYTPVDNCFIDPEVTSFGNDIGGDFGEFSIGPTIRSYGISLKASF